MSFKNTLLPVQTALQSQGRLLDLSRPVVMGILNATPDSFYTRGRHNSVSGMLQQAAEMIQAGAAILDVGGVSTRPGAAPLSASEETDRVTPVIEAISQEFPDAWISIDTYQATVARSAVEAGARIVNDISAGALDGNMLDVVAAMGVPYIAMHMQGTPQTMQQNPNYADVKAEVLDYLIQACAAASAAGINDIIIDPGFGFGKTDAHNFALLRNLHLLRIIGKPVLAGISRKSMICRTLGISPEQALNGTTALHMVALQQGATILRAHDVRAAIEVIKLFERITNAD